MFFFFALVAKRHNTSSSPNFITVCLIYLLHLNLVEAKSFFESTNKLVQCPTLFRILIG